MSLKFILLGLNDSTQERIKSDFQSEEDRLKKKIGCLCDEADLEMKNIPSNPLKDPLEQLIRTTIKCTRCNKEETLVIPL
jgi:hypothetical protein